jgi:putative acetyltransferase
MANAAQPRFRASRGFTVMSLTVREMRAADARAFLEVHHAAVRGIAAKDYPPDVIEAWAPLPLTRRLIAGVRANPDGDIG